MGAVVKRGLTQKEAAEHVGVSVRWFRDNVHVEPRAVGPVQPGRRPVLRYFVEELDAWMDKWGGVIKEAAE